MKLKNRKIKINITDTTLRDAHQSLLATRLRTADMLPIAKKIDQAGYWSVEMWGGATFDSSMRYLKEDPWERIRLLKGHMPNTPFQMLLRGQNLVGYKHYADDVVEKFVERAVANGINIFRVFDALNDFRNIKTAVKATLKNGGKVEGTICYTISPVHNNNLFVGLGRRLEDMGCDTICVKDMAGLLSPYDAFDLISELKKSVSVPIHLHTHDTSGMSVATYLKAVEAGVDIVDTAVSSLASGTSQPPVETFVNILSRLSKYIVDLNMDIISEISDYFREIRKKYKMFESEYTGVDPNVLIYQIPGGMTSNLASQLNEQQSLGKMKEVLQEVPKVRKEFGYPPLVTPISQIIGTQAALNVVTGERYKVITTETRNYLKGLYGKPPAPINEEVRKKVIGDEEFIEQRPADLLEPEMEKLTDELGGRAKNTDDVLLYALFPKVALDFLEAREKGITTEELFTQGSGTVPEIKDEATISHLAPSEFNIKLHGETYHVKVGGMGHPGEGGRPYFIYVDDQLEEILVESLVEVVTSVSGVIDAGATGHSIRPKAREEGDVTTPMPGTVVRIKVKAGDKVEAGDTVLIVEAMKMEHEVHTSISGVVEKIYVSEGDSVNPDEVLVEVNSKS
ncbi:MAG: sodium-extruding oxaloacetate decarboxylase subunit alpha [Nitrospirae bacterium]|nr:sodium-extruding oxaloacetate decarboxylase subunit alpha [Nitrospirota bacterium]